MVVYRVYVEKRAGLDGLAAARLAELRQLPQVRHLQGLRLLNRYDVQGVDEELFRQCVNSVLSEPPVDKVCFDLPEADQVLAVEYLPGQFDQRADSAAQCIQLISGQERPLVATARVYLLQGPLEAEELAAIRQYLINPLDSREAGLELRSSLELSYPAPPEVAVLQGLSQAGDDELDQYIKDYGLAMDRADLACVRQYFAAEGRDPSLTELRLLDTYWSDHCRHTTFNTTIDRISFQDPDAAAAWERYMHTRAQLGREHKPVNLMDLATLAARWLKATGRLTDLDESPEINACTVKITVDVDGEDQPWLLLFKNETHNHPTEIEPFGGAATCLGGAIRDPLSGRAYVYQAMRLSGAADPLTPLADTIPGKLPQRRITTQAADGYSSYGNQIGLATGLVDEVYHPGYAAKRMEVGAVIGAVPAAQVRREEPVPGDNILLLGGPTGRDGCGGATGSSKAHDAHSLDTCGAEVQKGNPPEERKLQRLFRNPAASSLIKRCNDFGAGGVAVACGELADGLHVWLDRTPRKYAGLDGTELAISESQERMAVVVAAEDTARFCELAGEENLQATVIAQVTAQPRLVMEWQGRVIVDLSRDLLNSNGAERHICIETVAAAAESFTPPADFCQGLKAVVSELNVCSKQGLSEKFDSTVGAGTVLMPFGGSCQLTPPQVMAAKLPLLQGETHTCSLMSWGFDPAAAAASPYHGSYQAVTSSVCKLAAAGAPVDQGGCWLSFQEYFPKPGSDPQRWGLPAAALLGAFEAQLDLGLAAIGGKDSMSGSFERLDVPPTLISFATAVAKQEQILSPEFKQAGHQVLLLSPHYKANGLPQPSSLLRALSLVRRLNSQGLLQAAWVPDRFGLAPAVFKMALGNDLGFAFTQEATVEDIFAPRCACFILEVSGPVAPEEGVDLRPLGQVLEQPVLRGAGQEIDLAQVRELYQAKLEPIFPCHIPNTDPAPPLLEQASDPSPRRLCRVRRGGAAAARPLFLIPAFPGTNCEWDTARAVERAGGRARILVLRNLSPAAVAASVRDFAAAVEKAQAIIIPGGFSGGDEPEGSAKLITAFLRNPLIADQVEALLQRRDGLMCGVCNGFQALIKLGLIPHGHISDIDCCSPTLTFNSIGRHQSRLVRTRICHNSSPWLARTQVGQVYLLPVSHGEGRFICPPGRMQELLDRGQVAAQYVDAQGRPSMAVSVNPNGSLLAVEALTSPDGRVLGKMAHSERIGPGLYKNVPGRTDMELFAAAVDYFTL